MPPEEVDIRFEAPTRELIDRLVRPTINLFLFDVHENTTLRQTNFPSARADGHAERRMPPRRVDLRYLVSALSTEIADEHELLWRAMVTLMKYPELPRELLPNSLRSLEPPVVARVWPGEETTSHTELWSALGAPPRPAIVYALTAPVELDVVISSPLVLTRTARYRRFTGDEAPAEERMSIGGVIRDATGEPLPGARVLLDGSTWEGTITDARGEFTLPSAAPGSVTVRIIAPDGASQLARLSVPSDTYEVRLEPAPRRGRR
jgi:hypothetical protein